MAAGRRDPGDFEEEIRAHLALEEDDLRATGLDADEARRRARATFGRAASARERLHDASRFSGLSTILQDLRYGIRLLRRRPAFSIAAAIVLSLGIGASTALFSVVNGLFHRPLGVAEPERLFYFYTRNWSGQVMNAVDPAALDFFRAESADLAEFTSHHVWRGMRMRVDQEVHMVSAGVVESNFFRIVGVGTVLGRTFRDAEDDQTNLERAMVISHDLWLDRFSRSPDVIGRRVELSDPNGGIKSYTIIGVAEPGFRGLTDALTPVRCWVTGAQTFDWAGGRSGVGNYGNGTVGRLKPGATLEQVRVLLAARTPVIHAQLFDRFSAKFRVANPDWPRRASYQVHGVLDVQIPRDPTAWLVEPSALIAMGAVVTMVLIIATANIAGLLVAQGIGRSSEIAVRRALGARGGRLARQVLTETTVLAVFGGVVGAGIAASCVAVFRATAPSPLVADTVVDWRVLLFATGISIGTGLLVGVMPAVQAVRVSVLESLGVGVVGSRRAGRSVGRWVLVPQTAVALVLLLVAAVHVRALAVIELVDPGFRAEGAQTIEVLRTEARPRPGLSTSVETFRRQNAEWWTRTWRFNYDLISKLENVTGVEAFGVTSRLPINQYHYVQSVSSEDSSLLPQDGKVAAVTQVVSDGYFDAVGTRLIAGRRFGSADVSNSVPVAIVSDALARALWPEGTPLGKRIGEPADPGRDIVWREVVGVVAEIDPIFKPKGQEPRIYKPLSQSVPLATLTVVIRTAADQPERRPDVRAAILGTDSTAEISRVRTMSQVLDEYLYPRRLAAAILLAAGGVGLVLAAVGLYGVVAYSAAQRLRELGIRATLGASPGDLIKLLIREAAMVSGGGVALGLALAYGALRLSASMYPDLPSLDVLSFVVAPTVLGLVVLAACLIPARHVVASAPARALRSE